MYRSSIPVNALLQVESDSSILFKSEDGSTEAENTSATTVYGEIVLIGGRDMANEMIEAGSVYDRALWSPMYPEPDYLVDLDISRNIYKQHQCEVPCRCACKPL